MRKAGVTRSGPVALRCGAALVAVLLLLALGRGTHAQADRAGLVVQFADGSVREFCVDLGGSERTGEELLRRSGLDVVAEVSALGTLVCRIGGTGCDYPAEICQCRCEDMAAGCITWSYNVLQDGRWRYSQLGAQARVVHAGDVDGWAWGPSTVQQGAAPPLRSFDQLCAAQAQPSPTPTGTSTPRPSGTRPPSATPRPTATPPPTASPPAGATARPSPTRTPGGTATAAVGSATATPAGYPGPFASTATALWRAGATEFAALAASRPAEPQRLSPSAAASIATQFAEATLRAAATATATLPAIAIVDRTNAGLPPGDRSTGTATGGYLAFLLLAAALGGAWWWLRRGRAG